MRSTVLLLCVLALPLGAVEPPRPPEAQSGKHLFILSGQSNMRQPLIGTFADVVKKVLGEDRVIVASHSRPGQPIYRWYRKWKAPEGVKVAEGGAKVYDELIGVVKKATQGRTIETVTLIWMQGEEDARAGWADRYEESFFGILEQLKADLAVRDLNFVIGRINDYWVPSRNVVDGNAMRALQVKLAKSTAKGAWIDTDDLNTGVNPWAVYEFDSGHFPNTGYRVMGQRFAREACKLVDPAAKLDQSLFEEAFLDDARQVKAHAAFEKAVTGTKPDETRSGGKAALSALVDGKLGTPDHRDPEWLAYPPTEKSIELLIDLGKPVEVSSVAVNLLLNTEAAAHFPTQIVVSVSENGTDDRPLIGFRRAVSFDKSARQRSLDKDFKPRACLVLADGPPLTGRYVKVEITRDPASKSWLFLDEVMVNPRSK